jgi:enamine deaminase RidA (YjgF/YER057c/UK114 family)
MATCHDKPPTARVLPRRLARSRTQSNTVYGEHFAAPYPARTTVAVSELPLGAKVEMEMLARKS